MNPARWLREWVRSQVLAGYADACRELHEHAPADLPALPAAPARAGELPAGGGGGEPAAANGDGARRAKGRA